jgi:hypothetical protein
VLLVAAGVLTLLFQRAEGRAFHLPGGDGGVITAAGLWTCLLILWRIFDKQGVTPNGPSATSSGVEWGIFIALAAAAFLAYSGSRIRAAHRPEPALPGEDTAPPGSNAAAVPLSGAAATAPAPGARASVRPSRAGAAAPASDAAATVRQSSAGATAPASDAAATMRRSSAGATAPRSDPSPPARRRARPPRPVSADHPAAAPAPAGARASSPPTQTQTQTEPGRQPTPAPDRPRRRPSAAELFEPVVFEDAPTMRLGRAGAPDEHPTTRITAAEPPPAQERPVPPDEQITTRLAAREDETVPLGRDETIPLGRDETLPLGDDDTLRFDDRRKRRS